MKFSYHGTFNYTHIVCLQQFSKGNHITSNYLTGNFSPFFYPLRVWEFSVLVRISHPWIKPPLRNICVFVFASPRRVFLIFLQQWHGGVILPGARQQPQCPLCRLSLRHRHCRREWRDPDEGEVPPHVTRQHRWSKSSMMSTKIIVKISAHFKG